MEEWCGSFRRRSELGENISGLGVFKEHHGCPDVSRLTASWTESDQTLFLKHAVKPGNGFQIFHVKVYLFPPRRIPKSWADPILSSPGSRFLAVYATMGSGSHCIDRMLILYLRIQGQLLIYGE